MLEPQFMFEFQKARLGFRCFDAILLDVRDSFLL